MIEIGILLASKAVDFVVTGCSSGQGMMLACNNLPGVICGYAPTPKDAYLFAQINNGNAISLPLGEEYTYSGSENCKRTIEMLFCESFGQGYPKEQSARKISDAKLLKSVKEKSQVDFITLLERLDDNLITKVLQKNNVVDYVLNNGTDIAMESGDIVIMEGDLENVVASIQFSKKVMTRIKENLFWAFAYNMILVPVAAGILYPIWGIVFRPEWAGLAMALSSVTVISLSLLLKRYVPPIKKQVA